MQNHFRGKVLWCPTECELLARTRACALRAGSHRQASGETEICQRHVSLAAQQDVLGLQIAVDDAVAVCKWAKAEDISAE